MSDVPKLKQPIGEKDHITGPSDAKVTLVEYGDYQCPYCGQAYPIVKEVQKKYADNLRFVFRNFPLTEVHPLAETGAEIAEAAAAQGKFWEMHDFIYEHQQNLSSIDFFLQFGEKLGLDANRMHKEISSHAYLPRIREDFSTGVRSGVNGTPTFFINDFRHNGDYSFETLTGAIENALKEPTRPKPKKTATTKKSNATKKNKPMKKKARAR
jgi:protein-disulfide isomerase